MFVVDVDDRDYQRAATRYLSTLSAGAQRATLAEAEATRARIASGAHWTNRTGKTAASFKVDQHPEQLSAEVRSGRKVALFLLNGTRPHVITPRGGGALRFVPSGGGAAVFARRVNHPGTKARPYLDAEATTALPRLASAVVAAAESAAATSDLR